MKLSIGVAAIDKVKRVKLAPLIVINIVSVVFNSLTPCGGALSCWRGVH